GADHAPLGNHADLTVRWPHGRSQKKNRKFWCYSEKPRSRYVELGAISDASAFCASRFFNKFRIFNSPEYSDSPPLPIKSRTIKRLQPTSALCTQLTRRSSSP